MRKWIAPAAVLIATVAQLVVASFSDLPQFAGKGFAARLVLYPVMMLIVPVAWRLWGSGPPPVVGFTLIMLPFLIDVTGNTLNLYDSISWWDDANHFVNWFLLCLGLALVLRVADLRPAWVRFGLVIGGGALLALIWELGEWYAFIRHGTELDTAYEDTLGDMTLGTCGAVLAVVVLTAMQRRVRSS
ncbi:hypothetical protein [Cryptosporangium phraense]|uniref:DUF2238 domain-containing protein n=1 Tax=Cryptosporangium phraense TaxID=2593070 RepID=A0A545AWY3_9ACTN|nr:hypothetical protein [Cryptosporangium phraense]TQS45839.1 hypothetical protein FL583_04780 [Cryptosporangium phraense]